MRFPLASFAALVAVVVLAACSASNTSSSSTAPQAGSGANAQMVTVRAIDSLKFDPSTITVKAGQPVQLTLTNTGQMQHDWSLNSGAAQPVKIVANAGQTAVGTFTIQEPGTYTFICSVPGHAAAGMQGTITAQ